MGTWRSKGKCYVDPAHRNDRVELPRSAMFCTVRIDKWYLTATDHHANARANATTTPYDFVNIALVCNREHDGSNPQLAHTERNGPKEKAKLGTRGQFSKRKPTIAPHDDKRLQNNSTLKLAVGSWAQRL